MRSLHFVDELTAAPSVSSD